MDKPEAQQHHKGDQEMVDRDLSSVGLDISSTFLAYHDNPLFLPTPLPLPDCRGSEEAADIH